MWLASRDSARTPVQWTAGENAGFTTGTPWIMVNPNYTEINVQAALADKDSVFYHYQALIKARHELEVVREGRYALLEPDREDVYLYTRTTPDQKLLVLCSFSEEPAEVTLPEEFVGGQVLLANLGRTQADKTMTLEPWESLVVLV